MENPWLYMQSQEQETKLTVGWWQVRSHFGGRGDYQNEFKVLYSMCMETDVSGEQTNMGSVGSLKYGKLFAPSSFLCCSFTCLCPPDKYLLFFFQILLIYLHNEAFPVLSIPSTASPHLFSFVPSLTMNLLPHLSGASQR